MTNSNIITIIVIGAVAIALIVFLAIKNAKDRKKIFPPTSTDPVEETNTEQKRGRETR